MLVLIFLIYLLLGDDDLNLRSNSHQEGGNDENMDNQDLNEVSQNFGGHMTRARTKRVKGALMQFMTKPMRGN